MSKRSNDYELCGPGAAADAVVDGTSPAAAAAARPIEFEAGAAQRGSDGSESAMFLEHATTSDDENESPPDDGNVVYEEARDAAVAFRRDEKDDEDESPSKKDNWPGAARRLSSFGNSLSSMKSPKFSMGRRESFRSHTLAELQAAGAANEQTTAVKESNVPFPKSWSGHKVTVFNPHVWPRGERPSGRRFVQRRTAGVVLSSRTRQHVRSQVRPEASRVGRRHVGPDHDYCRGDAV